MDKKGVLVVISGFSGAGKGTLMKNLLSKYDYALSISMTTRSPRPGETDGRDYFFVSEEKFRQTIEEGGFIEYANYCSHYYGTPRAYVDRMLSEGKDVILEIEAQGALQIKKKFPESFLVFIMTPDVDTLTDRLRGRGTESDSDINKRINRAAEEVSLISNYDAILINDDLDEATDRLHSLIQASGSATFRNKDLIESFHSQFAELLKGGK